MRALHLIGWIAAVIYSTVPTLWIVLHRLPRHFGRLRAPLFVVGPVWLAMCVAMAAITWPIHRLVLYSTPWSWLASAPLFAAGISLYALATRSFSPDQLLGRSEFHPHKHEQRLVTSGIRGHVRHPIYTGHFCELLGWAVGTGLVVVYAMALFALITGGIMIRAEERELERRFGDDYRRYRETVPAFFPRW
jgi:protein-S-isoprenylcysteine O-methyltransferase Ste14